jgi:hypothetical protein
LVTKLVGHGRSIVQLREMITNGTDWARARMG